MKRDSFIFYRSFANALSGLTDKQISSCMRALMAYALDGEEVKCDGVVKMFMELVRPQIDANNRRYENGSKGGRKPNQNQNETKTKPNNNQTVTKPKPKRNQKQTKSKPNVNVNDNVNVNVNVNKYKRRMPVPMYMINDTKDVSASDADINQVQEQLKKAS